MPDVPESGVSFQSEDEHEEAYSRRKYPVVRTRSQFFPHLPLDGTELLLDLSFFLSSVRPGDRSSLRWFRRRSRDSIFQRNAPEEDVT